MYMLQKQSEAAISDVDDSSSSSSSSCSEGERRPEDDLFVDDAPEEDGIPSLPVSSVDSLFSDIVGGGGVGGRWPDHRKNRSSGALLIAGKKSKPERISLRSTSDKDDVRLDGEYGLVPPGLSRVGSGGFRLPLAKIRTLFDAPGRGSGGNGNVVRYNPLGPPSFHRNTSSSSQTGSLVDLELAPMQRKHAADVPRTDWDLSKTVWGAHVTHKGGAFDASSSDHPDGGGGDWEAPSNAPSSSSRGPFGKWDPSIWLAASGLAKAGYPAAADGRRLRHWWAWQLLIVAVAGVAALLALLHYRSRW